MRSSICAEDSRLISVSYICLLYDMAVVPLQCAVTRGIFRKYLLNLRPFRDSYFSGALSLALFSRSQRALEETIPNSYCLT